MAKKLRFPLLLLMPQKNRRIRAPCIAFAPKKSNGNIVMFVVPCLNYNLAILLPPSKIPHTTITAHVERHF